MAPQKSLYDVLGIQHTASQDEIARAFRKAAFNSHPDRHAGDCKAEEQFKEVNEAYQVLGDANRRAVYDRYGTDGLRRGFCPPTNESHGERQHFEGDDNVWDRYTHRWQNAYAQRGKSNGIVMRDIDPNSELFARINELKADLEWTLKKKQFGDLFGIVDDLMSIHEGYRGPVDAYSVDRVTIGSVVRDIPQDVYTTVFGVYDASRGHFHGGIAVLEEILEHRLAPHEMEALDRVCWRLKKHPRTMRRELAVNATDLYLLDYLRQETKDFYGMDFKAWNWRNETRRMVAGRLDHYRANRKALEDILDVAMSTVEEEVSKRYFDLFSSMYHDSPLSSESAAFYEDGFMAASALSLLSEHVPSRMPAWVALLPRRSSPLDHLSQQLVRSERLLLDRTLRLTIHRRHGLRYDNLPSFVNVIKRMAEIAGTKEAEDVLLTVGNASGLWFW